MAGAAENKSVVRRALVPLMLAVALVIAFIYIVGTTRRVALLSNNPDGNLVGAARSDRPQGKVALANVSALAANPLDQKAVNGAIAARLRATGDVNRAIREIALLRQLGWRNTRALQNLLWRAGNARDLPLMMDTLDALLRREKLLGEVYPILNLMAMDPAFRGLLTQRLAARPPWRPYYLMSASDLSRPEQIEGRYFLMRAIQKRGDKLTRNEVAPILPKLIGVGRSAQAFDLWRAQQGGKLTTPLTDIDLANAARSMPADALPVPFEWQLGSGSGYVVDASRDERGSFMSIDWSGRGAPSFATQLTSGRAGRYRLEVTGDPPMSRVANRIGFRLVCPDGKKAEFNPVKAGAGERMQLVGAGPVPCDYSKLELYGLTETGTSAVSVVLRTVRLERIN